MSTKIQFANNNNESFANDECIEKSTELDIEFIIDEFYDYVDDINSIHKTPRMSTCVGCPAR